MRLYEMFMGEFELPKPWDPRAIEGCARFLKRVWRLTDEHGGDRGGRSASRASAASGITAAEPAAADPNRTLRHRTIKRVTVDLERMQFNTAIAAMMEYVNGLVAEGASREDLLTLVRLVGPFAPHLADEAWERLGQPGFLVQSSWPVYDEELTRDATVTVAIQVDGKVRGTIELLRDTSEEDARRSALAVPNVARHLEGRQITKFLYKAGRIIGFVTRIGEPVSSGSEPA